MTHLPRATALTRPDPGAAYRFDRFTVRLLVDDLTFGRDAPGAGDPVPAFDLPTLDGGRFRSGDLGPRPVLLVFGSRTCPVTESAGPVLRRLHDEYADRVRFVLVNTREAHPGDVFGQPRTAGEKRAHAEELRDRHGVPFEVAVDDVDGRLHRAMSPKPNSAYLIDPGGVVRHRTHWANDERGLRSALAAVVAGRTPPRPHSRRMAGPLLRAVGHLPGVTAFAGRTVERDVWRAAPPLALLGRLSRLFPWLPADRRGPAAVALLGVLLAGLVAAVAALT
ncbi:TlpA family protein disulfide reductase [Micromonospora haikouensis]|uniref:TlpA family protein disulfide reductase n=1 Tax=Micromonospora haikouensis TaxID=686309 RepID=UPI00378E6CDD